MLYGALEAGGTKMVCAIGNEKGEILEQISIPTTTPKETMPPIIEYFQNKKIAAIGVACFGPVDLNLQSQTYGCILQTPKIAWRGFDMVGCIRDALHIPVGFDTDVNGSLLGEATWGCAKGLENAVYFTIGTGIGAGIMTNGKMLHGMLHPEAGHFMLSVRSDDTYKGRCPSHGTCLEGMAAGPAIEERWGASAKKLADRPEVWDLESYYLAQAVVSCVMLLSPQIIIFGGGVMHQQQLFPLIRQKSLEMINGYIQTPLLENMEHYIVPASLNDNQGIMGCIRLAMDAQV